MASSNQNHTPVTDPASCRVLEDYLRHVRHMKENLEALKTYMDSSGDRHSGLLCQILPDKRIDQTNMRMLTERCKHLLESCRTKVESHVEHHPKMRQCHARQPVDSGVISATNSAVVDPPVQEQGATSLDYSTVDENTRVKSVGGLPSQSSRAEAGTHTDSHRQVKSAPAGDMATREDPRRYGRLVPEQVDGDSVEHSSANSPEEPQEDVGVLPSQGSRADVGTQTDHIIDVQSALAGRRPADETVISTNL